MEPRPRSPGEPPPAETGATPPIRRAGPPDRDGLLELIAEFYEIDGHPFDRATVVRGLVPLLESDEHGIVLLSEDGYAVLVWSYSLESGGRDALLDEIYVRRRGQGTGRALMERVFAEMAERGLTRVFLETEPDNERARAFYSRLGFRSEESVWMVADLG